MTDETAAPTAEAEATEVEETAEVEAASETERAEDAEKPESEGTDESAEQEQEQVDLLKKFKGDIKAADRSYWHAVNRATRVQDENRVLRERLSELEQGSKARPAEREEPRTEEPLTSEDIKRIDMELSEVDGEMKQAKTDYEQGLLDIGEADKAIAKIEGKLEDALEEQKPALEARLEAARVKRLQIIRDAKGALRWHQEAKHRGGRLRAERSTAERMVKMEQTNAQKVESERMEVYRDFPVEVDAMFEQACIDLAVSKEDREDFWEIVNQDLMAKLWAAGAQGHSIADVNVEGIIKGRVQKLMARIDGGRGEFAKKSKEALERAKASGTKVVAPGSRAVVGKPKPDQMAIARAALLKRGL